MENSSSSTNKDHHDNTHPKPNEDPGAEIETVTPDTEKEGAPNDTKITSVDTKNPSQADQKDEAEDINGKEKPDTDGNDDEDSENPIPGEDQKEGDGPEIETIAP